MKKNIFINFEEFWHYTKTLTIDQRDILLGAMSSSERRKLKKSYQEEGWEDLFMRNYLDSQLDFIKEKLGVDMLQVRCTILEGGHYNLPRKKWKQIYQTFSIYGNHATYILGGIYAELINKTTIMLLSRDSKKDQNEENEGFN
jgi:sugar diacid utilization regulator